jgi:DNA-binding PadR family transcriptional regulator
MATRLIGDFLDLYILKLLEVQNMCVGEILESVKRVNKMNNAKSRIVIKKATLYSHINKLKKEGKIVARKGLVGRKRRTYSITPDGIMWLSSYSQNLG